MSIRRCRARPRRSRPIYETPYLSHSPMEPMNATVHLQPDRLDVWVGTQAADEALEAAAKASGLKPEQVYIHNAFVGGGFGRRDANDEVMQAIAIAKVVQAAGQAGLDARGRHPPGQIPPACGGRLQGRRRRRRNADRMVDARRHLVDLRFGRQAVPGQQGRAAGRRRTWPTTATTCRTRASKR